MAILLVCLPSKIKESTPLFKPQLQEMKNVFNWFSKDIPTLQKISICSRIVDTILTLVTVTLHLRIGIIKYIGIIRIHKATHSRMIPPTWHYKYWTYSGHNCSKDISYIYFVHDNIWKTFEKLGKLKNLWKLFLRPGILYMSSNGISRLQCI